MTAMNYIGLLPDADQGLGLGVKGLGFRFKGLGFRMPIIIRL